VAVVAVEASAVVAAVVVAVSAAVVSAVVADSENRPKRKREVISAGRISLPFFC
jgi:hypothetical protein